MYMTLARKSVPASLRESSLIDFIQTVSAEKSNDKPLSSQAIEDRIRQRALTLVGGGINSSMSTTGKQASNKRHRRHEELSNRQRKKLLKQRAQEKKQVLNNKEKDEKAFNTLLEVNQKWNIYVRKLAGITDMKKEEHVTDDDDSLRKTLSPRLAQVELVGAFVNIVECRAHKEWVGKEGLVVATTTNTWRLAIIKLTQKQKQQPRVLVVPKRGSKLMFRLSMGESRSPLCVVIRGDSNDET